MRSHCAAVCGVAHDQHDQHPLQLAQETRQRLDAREAARQKAIEDEEAEVAAKLAAYLAEKEEIRRESERMRKAAERAAGGIDWELPPDERRYCDARCRRRPAPPSSLTLPSPSSHRLMTTFDVFGNNAPEPVRFAVGGDNGMGLDLNDPHGLRARVAQADARYPHRTPSQLHQPALLTHPIVQQRRKNQCAATSPRHAATRATRRW